MAKKNSDPTLTDVSGIGPARAKQLKKAGIKSPKQLAQYKPETVAEKTDIAQSRAQKLVENARKATGKTKNKKSTTKKSSKKTKKKSSKKDTKKAAKAAAKAMEDIIARARDHFKQAPEEHHFHLRSGSRLKDLRELAEALEEMEEHVFRHHVTDDRHDFANWVQDVLDEHALAEQLRDTRKHPEAHGHVIYRHITRRVW